MIYKECDGCGHWRCHSGYSGDKYCNYILDVGHRRPRDDPKHCKGFVPRESYVVPKGDVENA